MGTSDVQIATDDDQLQQFLKYLLRDIRALGQMLEEGWFEIDTMRIGAEQELCLVDSFAKPAPIALKVLEKLDKEIYTTELALFNFEINLKPLEFTGDCLSTMEKNLQSRIDNVREAAREFNGDVMLAGILPTIRKYDLELENLTPLPRYKALCEAINKLRGNEYELRINGMDELLMKFDSPLLEACNTGWQVHLQVTPDEFVQKYNYAQAITGPVLASAVNSPLLFGKRLWSETRVALFQQSVDTRKVGDHLRDSSPRVTFGNQWVEDSILQVYKEDIARYRVMLSSEVNEDVEQKMQDGETPELNALQIHNSTVYRWNRPCYGISDGKAHLRIENRILPSGPTVVDEVANASFWLGLLNGLDEAYEDISEEMAFDDARANFVAASKMGLDTNFKWVDGKKIGAVELLQKELIPLARKGLEKTGIDSADISTYMDIIEERVDSAQTGAYWMVQSYSDLIKDYSKDQTLTAITSSLIKNQKKGEPVHKWGLAKGVDMESWQPSSLLVEEFMTTDLFTVHKSDIIEFVAEIIEWRKIRYVPVEDDNKHLVGLVSMRMVFRNYHNRLFESDEMPETVDEIMIKNPITIHPEASIMEAMELMDNNKIGCLPVVKNNRLVGIITETNYMTITARLLRVLYSDKQDDEDGDSDE